MCGFGLGVTIFLLGLRLMSTALGSAAGRRLRGLLARFVKTPLQGALLGAAATAAVQSSSAVAATVVGLVNARIFTLSQAFAVILGANVGTTITAQLIAFDLDRFAPLMMAAGLVSVWGWRRRTVGEALFGFGSLLFGLALINRALLPWLDSGAARFALTSLVGERWQAVLVGIGVTAVVQSSSAVTGFVVALAQAETITLQAAVCISLGSNIGTVLTTLIASIGTSRESKAAALADLTFNVLGVLLVLPLLDPFLAVVARTSTQLPRQIANAHTLFNLGTAVIALPLIRYLAGFAWLWAGIVGGRKKY
jgi:phosphate:Na+ symporter